MLKIIWNWLMWQFYKGNAGKLLIGSKGVLQTLSDKQKLDYAMNAIYKIRSMWIPLPSESITVHDYVMACSCFGSYPTKEYADFLNKGSLYFKGIALDEYDYHELAYALYSITRMLAIIYPNYGIKLDGDERNCCTDSEALTRIAASIVSSVAIAHGHERGVRAYGKVYREMIEYGRGLV